VATERLRILIEDDLNDRVLIAHTSRVEGLACAIVAVDSCAAFTAAPSTGGIDIMPADDRLPQNPS
jgi:hypothetical protein